MELEELNTKLHERFARVIEHAELTTQELTIDVAPQHLGEVMHALRDDPAFAFKLLLDVCGVDYLHYGLSEWETTDATATGFERGVDRDRASPEAGSIKPSPQAIAQQLAGFAGHAIAAVATPQDSGSTEVMPLKFTPRGAIRQRFASVYHLLSLKHNMRLRVRVFIDEAELRVPSVIDIWPSADWYEREAFDLYGIVYVGHPDLRRLLTDYGFIGHPFRKDFPLIGNVEVRYDAKEQRVIYEPVNIKPRVLEPKVIRHDNRYLRGD